MANVQSPPGLLSVDEFFKAFGIQKFQKELRRIGHITKHKNKNENYKADYFFHCTLFDTCNLKSLEEKLQKAKYPLGVEFILIKLNIYEDGSHELLEIRRKNYLSIDARPDYAAVFKIMHQLRYLLSGKYLEAYVMNNYVYHKIPPEFWHHDKNWYRLLADCCAYGSIPTVGDILGAIYFKKEDVDHCLSLDFEEQSNKAFHTDTSPLLCNFQSLINLDLYTTPWLQVLSAIYEEFGQEKLAQVSKVSIEYFIHDYIKKYNLDVSASDIPFLAKFIRLAEQKEGRKYQTKQKLQKLNEQK